MSNDSGRVGAMFSNLRASGQWWRGLARLVLRTFAKTATTKILPAQNQRGPPIKVSVPIIP